MKFKRNALILSLLFAPLTITSCGKDPIQAEFDSKTHFIYELAKENGQFSGTYEEWLDSITGPAGKDGLSITDIVKTNSTEKEVTYKVIFNDGTTKELVIPLIKGEKGDKGEPGPQGEKGEIGPQGPQGDKGEAGKDGISITKIFKTGSEGLVDTYTIVYSDGTTSTFIVTNGQDGTDGKQGIQGIKGEDGHTPVIEINDLGNWVVDNVDTGIKAQGPKGDDGVSISKVEKTATNGLVDTYTITYSDGHISTFVITNGKDGQQGAQGIQGNDGHTPVLTIGENGHWLVDGKDTGIAAQGPKGDKGDQGEQGNPGQNGQDGVSITSITKTKTEGLVDTYTITYSNGNTSTFTVTNGKDGVDGQDGATGPQGDKGDTGAKGEQGIQGVTGKDGHTPVINIGPSGNWVIDGVDSGIAAQGPKGDKGDKGEQGLPGQNGQDGVDGQDGAPGKSAYEIYKENFPEYTKSEAEWLDDLINGRLGNKEIHTVTFDTKCSVAIDNQLVEHGEKIKKPVDPVNPGYTFNGWTYQGEPWSFIGYVVTENMTLTANWAANEYKLNINYDNGQSSETKIYHYKDTVSIENPVKSGYKFIGWQNELGTEVTFPLEITSDLNIIAKYSDKVNIHFDTAGGNVLEDQIAPINGVVETLPTPTKPSAVFKGWYLENGETSQKIELPYTNNSNEDFTLIAHWDNLVTDFAFEILPDGNAKLLKYGGSNEVVNVPETYQGHAVTEIDANAFADSTIIQKVVIGNNVTTIGDNAFKGCTNLTDIHFGDNVTNYGANLLLGDTNLTKVRIRNNVKLLKLFGFDQINLPENLKVQLPYNSSDTSYTRDMLFSQVTKPFDLILEDSFVSIPNLYFCDTSVRNINFPNTLISIGDSAFTRSNSLININIPDNVTTLGCRAFESCSKLQTVKLSNKITTIKEDCFAYCRVLRTIQLPKELKTIQNRAFFLCANIQNFRIPSSVSYIGYYALDMPLRIFETSKNTNNINLDSANLEEVDILVIHKNLVLNDTTRIDNANISIYYGGTKEEWFNLKLTQSLDNVTFFNEDTFSIKYEDNYGYLDLGNEKHLFEIEDNTVKDIDLNTFFNGKNLTTILPKTFVPNAIETLYLSQDIATIDSSTLDAVTELIYIPKTLKTKNKPYLCPTNRRIYFEGSKSQWDSLFNYNNGDSNNLMCDVNRSMFRDINVTNNTPEHEDKFTISHTFGCIGEKITITLNDYNYYVKAKLNGVYLDTLEFLIQDENNLEITVEPIPETINGLKYAFIQPYNITNIKNKDVITITNIDGSTTTSKLFPIKEESGTYMFSYDPITAKSIELQYPDGYGYDEITNNYNLPKVGYKLYYVDYGFDYNYMTAYEKDAVQYWGSKNLHIIDVINANLPH